MSLLKYLFISIIICFSSLIIDGYIQFFGKNLFGYTLYNNYRVSSFFGSELILGSYLARFFPLYLVYLFYLISQKNKTNISYDNYLYII